MDVGRSGVQRSGGKSEIESERVFLLAWNFGKNCVELNEIRFVSLQECVQFSDGALHLLLNGFVMIEILETDGEFHKRTCSEIGGVTLARPAKGKNFGPASGKRAGRGLSLEAASGGA